MKRRSGVVRILTLLTGLSGVDFVCSPAEAAFLNSREIVDRIRSLSKTFNGLAESSKFSESEQNRQYLDWVKELIALKGIIFKGDENLTCRIQIEQEDRGVDRIHLSVSLVDSKGNKKNLSELGLTLLKQPLSAKELDTQNVFFCENFSKRSDCPKLQITTYKTPQLSGVLDESLGNAEIADIYGTAVTEKAVAPKSESEPYAAFVLEEGKPVEGIPNQCYFEKQSELTVPSRIVRASQGSCYLVRYLKGQCNVSPMNLIAGIKAENKNTLCTESVLNTDKLLPLVLESDLGDGLYRLNENDTLSALDENLGPQEHVPAIQGHRLGDQERLNVDFSEDKNATIKTIADTFNQNQFLTSLDLMDHPFDENFFVLLSDEARQRLHKVVLNSGNSPKFSEEEKESLKVWFPRLDYQNIVTREKPMDVNSQPNPPAVNPKPEEIKDVARKYVRELYQSIAKVEIKRETLEKIFDASFNGDEKKGNVGFEKAKLVRALVETQPVYLEMVRFLSKYYFVRDLSLDSPWLEMVENKSIAEWKKQVHGMVNSTEFWQQCVRRKQVTPFVETRKRFVEQCYEKICGRNGEEDGVAHWCKHYDNVGQHRMLQDFINHGAPTLVKRVFEHYRNRTPSPQEVDRWSETLSNGRLDDLLVEILMSDYPDFVGA